VKTQGQICMQMKYSSSCGSNFNSYMASWDSLTSSIGNPALSRPPISARVDSNVTVTPSWLRSDEPHLDLEASERYGRIGTHHALLMGFWCII
jgi:hypothetical protein